MSFSQLVYVVIFLRNLNDIKSPKVSKPVLSRQVDFNCTQAQDDLCTSSEFQFPQILFKDFDDNIRTPTKISTALLVGAVEYSEGISAEEYPSPIKCLGYDIKQSVGEAAVLELWGM